jgi:hypothetical protein
VQKRRREEKMEEEAIGDILSERTKGLSSETKPSGAPGSLEGRKGIVGSKVPS